MARANIKTPRHKILVLQDILGLTATGRKKKPGFEASLALAGISYKTEYLHYSKHDVGYLLELFKKVYLEYSALTGRECCVVNIATGIIHTPECRCIKGRQHETVAGGKRMIFSGYKPCKFCGTEQEWKWLQWDVAVREKGKKVSEKEMRALLLTESNIQRICSHFGLKCSIVSGIIFLTTSVGYWRIYFADDKADQVLHGNYRMSRADFFLKKKKKYREGFHVQDVSAENLYDVVKYIYYHDRNLYKKNRKSRIDLLFEKIEQKE